MTFTEFPFSISEVFLLFFTPSVFTAAVVCVSSSGRPVSDRGNWREREEATGEHWHDGGWRERGEMRRGPSGYEKRDKWEQRRGRGGGGGEMRGEQPPVFHPHPQSYTHYQDGGFQNRSRPPRPPRGRQHHSSRQTYQLAPR